MAGAWPGLGKGGVGQERIIAVTGPATVGREGALWPEEAALGAMTMRAGKPLRVQVTLQPDEADAVIQPFGHRDIKHIGMIPHSARSLHMSQYYIASDTEVRLNRDHLY